MVRNGSTLREAATQLQVPITSADCENIQRRKGFQKLLRDARNQYHAEVGADPGLTRNATVGRLSILAEALAGAGELDKAAEVLFKMAKLAGWMQADSTVNVFGGLTSKDYEEVRKRLNDAPETNFKHVN